MLNNLKGQDEISLRNPSFENPSPDFEDPRKPMYGRAPKGWVAYGSGSHNELENSPDPQPGNFLVSLPAANGTHYLGMVTRDKESNESISQRLRLPLIAGKCYTFNIKAYLSAELESISRMTDDTVKYNQPIKLRFWGGAIPGHRGELLAESSPIRNNNWKQYNFRFEPVDNHVFFTIEAYYVTPVPVPYNGNVMIDDASNIKLIPCSEEEEPPIVNVEIPVEEEEKPVNVKPSRPKPEPKPEPEDERIVTTPPKQKPSAKFESPILKLDRKKMVEGQVVRIENLYFKADSANIAKEAYPVLDEIFGFLQYNRDITIEVGGHTNNRCETKFCDGLSEKRAKAVADYLRQKGIRNERLLFKGYGKRNPVATNATPTGRKRNQRVEFKILNMDD